MADDCGSRVEACKIIAAARNVSAQEAMALFCAAWNSNGLKLWFSQTTRNPFTLELAAWEPIEVPLREVTCDSFAAGPLSQLKQWLAPNPIVDAFQRLWIGDLESHTDPDGTIFWTRTRPVGFVSGDQLLQMFEVDLGRVRAAFPAPPSPPEPEQVQSEPAVNNNARDVVLGKAVDLLKASSTLTAPEIFRRLTEDYAARRENFPYTPETFRKLMPRAREMANLGGTGGRAKPVNPNREVNYRPVSFPVIPVSSQFISQFS